MDFIEVEIVNWGKYNPRRDYKKPWWFALSNTITSDGMFSDFSDAEFKAWIHILCSASVQNSNRAKVFFKHAERSAGIKRKSLIDVIEKLKILEVIRVPAGICTDSVHDLFGTEQNRTEQTDSASKEAPFHQLVWNKEIRSLPKVTRWTKSRQIGAEKLKADQAEWTDACRRVEASEFLSGRSGKWLNCGFDWLLKPANFTKVIEGNYDNRALAQPISAGSMRGA